MVEDEHNHKRARIDDDSAHAHIHHHHSKTCLTLSQDPENLRKYMIETFHFTESRVFSDPEAALKYAFQLYNRSCDTIKSALKEFCEGECCVWEKVRKACYPIIGEFLISCHAIDAMEALN